MNRDQRIKYWLIIATTIILAFSVSATLSYVAGESSPVLGAIIGFLIGLAGGIVAARYKQRAKYGDW